MIDLSSCLAFSVPLSKTVTEHFKTKKLIGCLDGALLKLIVPKSITFCQEVVPLIHMSKNFFGNRRVLIPKFLNLINVN